MYHSPLSLLQRPGSNGIGILSFQSRDLCTRGLSCTRRFWRRQTRGIRRRHSLWYRQTRKGSTCTLPKLNRNVLWSFPSSALDNRPRRQRALRCQPSSHIRRSHQCSCTFSGCTQPLHLLHVKREERAREGEREGGRSRVIQRESEREREREREKGRANWGQDNAFTARWLFESLLSADNLTSNL